MLLNIIKPDFKVVTSDLKNLEKSEKNGKNFLIMKNSVHL